MNFNFFYEVHYTRYLDVFFFPVDTNVTEFLSKEGWTSHINCSVEKNLKGPSFYIPSKWRLSGKGISIRKPLRVLIISFLRSGTTWVSKLKQEMGRNDSITLVHTDLTVYWSLVLNEGRWTPREDMKYKNLIK